MVSKSYDRLDDAWSIAIKAVMMAPIIGVGAIALLAGPEWMVPWATGVIGFGSGFVYSLHWISRGIAGEAEDLMEDEQQKNSERDRYA